MYPFLSLKQIAVDPALVRLLPRRLAYYHLALPIARDDDHITVAVALSDNPKVIALLGAALNAPVMLVRSPQDEIKAILDTVWQAQGDIHQPNILAWVDSSAQQSDVRPYAELFAAAFSAETTIIDSNHSTLETALQIVSEGYFSLLVANESSNELPSLLNRAQSPILLVQGEQRSIQKVLVVLRGHTPDRSVLDFIMPLVKFYHAQITLLAVAQPVSEHITTSNISDLLSTNSSFGAHIEDCVNLLNEAHIPGQLKLRQGVTLNPEDEIATEASQDQYDLIAIAAEAYGDFVYNVLTSIQEHASVKRCPLLIVKPNFFLDGAANGNR